MAVNGKKINELVEISNITNETVLPAVRVNNEIADDTATKISLEQISDKVQDNMSTILNEKQDKLTAGNGITILDNVISAIETNKSIDPIVSTFDTINLSSNKVYKITLNGNTTFVLPSISDNTIFNQILLQVYISGSITINFGTTKYFNEAPDVEEGYCNIIYEYDSIQNAWVVGLLKKV